MENDKFKLLAGDIGGTKTILQVAEYTQGRIVPVIEKRYESQKFDTFERMLIRFYGESGISEKDIVTACVGVAGPVTTHSTGRSTSRVTNLPWKLDTTELESQFCQNHFRLINDFQAIGYGIECLGKDDVVSLQQGESVDKGTRAIIGAGTGLGQAYMVWDASLNSYKVMPSEAGHSSFAPNGKLQRQLLENLSGKYETVSLERVVSGPGITNIYHFLSQQKSGVPGEIILSASDSQDITPTIVTQALSNENTVAVDTLDVFTEAYGAAAGNLALTVAATGGVYVAGGIAPKILEKIKDGKFISAFNNKSKMKSWLEKIPVAVITNEKTGLLGAANFGVKTYLSAGN